MIADMTRSKSLTLTFGATALLALTSGAASALPVSDADARQACTADMAYSGIERMLATRGTPVQFGVFGVNLGRLIDVGRQRVGQPSDAGAFVDRLATTGTTGLLTSGLTTEIESASAAETARVRPVQPTEALGGGAGRQGAVPTEAALPELGRVAATDAYFESAFVTQEFNADDEQQYTDNGVPNSEGPSVAIVYEAGEVLSVPEPGITVLLVVGTLALVAARRRRITHV